MPDSILHDSMRRGITCSAFLFVFLFVCFVFLWGDTCFPQDEKDGIVQFYHYKTGGVGQC